MTEHEASSDTGTVLGKDSAAVIYNPADDDDQHDGFGMYIPRYAEDQEVPPPVLLLCAMFTRMVKDQEWVDELMQWWEEQKS